MIFSYKENFIFDEFINNFYIYHTIYNEILRENY